MNRNVLGFGNSGNVAFSSEIAMPLNFTAKYEILPKTVRRGLKRSRKSLDFQTVLTGADQIDLSVWAYSDHVVFSSVLCITLFV